MVAERSIVASNGAAEGFFISYCFHTGMCGCEAAVCSWLKFTQLQKCAADVDLYRPEACACGLHETEYGELNSASVSHF